jgi:hypothetical protein
LQVVDAVTHVAAKVALLRRHERRQHAAGIRHALELDQHLRTVSSER